MYTQTCLANNLDQCIFGKMLLFGIIIVSEMNITLSNYTYTKTTKKYI